MGSKSRSLVIYIGFQVLAPPPAKKTAGQIEKETEVSYKCSAELLALKASSLIEKET